MADERSADDRPQGTVPLTPAGSGKPRTPPDRLLGQMVDGRYRLRAVLGEGGMGRVYLAEDEKLNRRRVALKLMGSALTMDPEFRARFQREALLQANLPHPQIIQVIDIGEGAEGAYIVMEYSDGQALSTLLRELGPRPLDRALDITEQLLETLDFAHRQGIVHRDLKPSNILVESRAGREFVRILDFGIAKLMTAEGAEHAITLTKAGHAYGTLGYMAPEQAKGEIEKLDHRADVYAVGIILYEMLTGQVPAPPEARTHPVRYAMWVAANPFRPLRESHPDLDVAEEVDKILRSALRRDPDKRYPSALAFLNAIRQFRRACDASTVRRAPVDAGAAPAGDAKTPGGTPRAAKPSTALAAWVLALLFAGAAALGWWQWYQVKDRPAGGGDAEAEAARAELSAARKAVADAGLGTVSIEAAIRRLATRPDAGSADADGDAARRELEAQLADTGRQLEAARTAHEKALADAKAELDRVRREQGDAASREAAARTEIETAKRDLETARRERDAAIEAEKRAREQGPPAAGGGDVAAIQKRLDDESRRVRELEETIRAQGRELEASQKKAGEAETERNRLRAEKEQLAKAAESAERERGLLAAGIQEKDRRIADLERAASEAPGSPEAIRALTEERDAARRNADSERQRAAALEQSNRTAESERDQAMARVRAAEAQRDDALNRLKNLGGSSNPGGGPGPAGGTPSGTQNAIVVRNSLRSVKIEITSVRVQPPGGAAYDVNLGNESTVLLPNKSMTIAIPAPGDVTVRFNKSQLTGAKLPSGSKGPIPFVPGMVVDIDF